MCTAPAIIFAIILIEKGGESPPVILDRRLQTIAVTKAVDRLGLDVDFPE